ncbi:flagellin [Paraneptunicella aestuarii]|uniref:flagellin N-terminal helical domain-containing protein n=1 Tax=Paraneptunicella aestuarii TaxID=2831148 RepID=UPI001E292148|nr:flagellin [Paraneptunicella aestuarii]UAA38174.1 flagellin [Paraneptunicella aestuarii]
MINLSTKNNSSILQQVQNKQDTLFERLASGKRINKAADGAAAQQIIDRLTAQQNGLGQAYRNSLDGISLSQVAEGGLSGINSDVNRIRELSIQAGNGILSAGDRKAIQSEISQLQQNIQQTVEQTEFGGKKLLTSDGSVDFLVGANSGQNISVGTKDIASALSGILSVDVTTAQGAQDALSAADDALEYVGSERAELGAIQNRFESAARNLAQTQENVAAANSRIGDLDYAQATAERASNDILSQASIAVQSQANQNQNQVLSLLG